jgi:NAD(P)-dependent dehydrogenase (short-subunit alcohol dehydrogenase family)
MSRFSDKVVFISGGASGMGLATAQWLAKEGAKLVIADVDWDLAQKAAADVGKAGVAVKLDQGNPESVQEAIAFAESKFGGINYAVNAAGIQGPQGAVEDIEPEDMQNVYAVNLMGIAFCLKYQVAAIKNRGGGSIVNIASAAGVHAVPYLGIYSSTKAGVNSLTAAVAQEAGKYKIRVNSVCPGYVDTPLLDARVDRDWAGSIVPTGRCGVPSYIADAVAFLLSEDARQITGVNLPVDGGLLVINPVKPPGF